MNNFDLIKKNIQTGDILLSRGIRSPISEAIGGITHSYWSHSFLYLGDNQIIDALYDGVKIHSLDYYLKGEYAVGLYRHINPLTDEQKSQLVKVASRFAGKHYGWLQLMYQCFLRLIGKSEDPKWAWRIKGGVICSEMVALIYQKIGIMFKCLPPSQMEPVDFDESPLTVRIA